jgi:2-dehydro-3-deoxyphosphogluconate aldolase/(4S)-4-hydroxy-2-oxoglutarate aldolase
MNDDLLGGSRVVAIIRTSRYDDAAAIARAVVGGGIRAVEITATVPNAPALVAELVTEFGADALVGAGTVLTPDQVTEFVAAGARFVLSPVLNHDVVAAAHAAGIVVIPGALTPTEVAAAAALGVAAVKVYPAASVGVGHVRALRDVMPDVRFVPTGGIGPGDATEWLAAGAAAVGIGGAFTAAYSRGGPAAVEGAARQVADHLSG